MISSRANINILIQIGRATGNFVVSVYLVDDEDNETLHQSIDFSTNEESMIVENVGGGSFSDVFVRAKMKVSTKEGKVIKIKVGIPTGKAKPIILLSMETKAAYQKILEMNLPRKLPGAFFCAEGNPGLSHLAAMGTIYEQIDPTMPCLHILDDNIAGVSILLSIIRALPMKLFLPRPYLETLSWYEDEYLNSHSKKALSNWDKTRANNMIKSGEIGEKGVKYLQYLLKCDCKYESETLLQILSQKPGGILPYIQLAISSNCSQNLMTDPVLDLRPSSAVSDDKEKTSNSGDDKDPDEEMSNMSGDDKEPENETQLSNTQEESSQSQSQPLLSTTQETTTTTAYSYTNIAQPGLHDVMIGRGGGTDRNPGNIRFRQLVCTRKDEYKSERSNSQKSIIAQEIVTAWRTQVPPGRFLKQDKTTELWNDIGDKEARERTKAKLRDANKPNMYNYSLLGKNIGPYEETSGDDKEKETQLSNTQEESSQSQPLLSTTQEESSQSQSQPLLSTTQETTTSQKLSQPLLSTQDPN